jgi:adenine C2-methylase RlmN of 23S rRNA A2503 and tRNA A37
MDHTIENNFDVYRTDDGTVSKYIHEDGSETAVKLVKSLQNILNPLTNQIETRISERNKYSLFISSSVGCYMKCKFCHLTLKNAEHIKIEEDQVLANLKEAIEDTMAFNPDMKNRYVKLSWMGMGDAINKPNMVKNVSLKLLDWIFEKGYAKGLDGIDLSTVMPKLKKAPWIPIFHSLEDELQKYPRNPAYQMDNVEFSNNEYKKRNIFRLFYSIESAIQDKREYVVPNAMPLVDAMKDLKEYQQDWKYPVILHHLLVDGLNDSQEELDALIEMVSNNFPTNELRILRYNYCAKSDYKESEKFIGQIRQLSQGLNFIKVQISPGTEVSAACGQFIVKDFIRLHKEK